MKSETEVRVTIRYAGRTNECVFFRDMDALAQFLRAAMDAGIQIVRVQQEA